MFSGNNRAKKCVCHIKISIDLYVYTSIMFKIKMLNLLDILKYVNQFSHILQLEFRKPTFYKMSILNNIGEWKVHFGRMLFNIKALARISSFLLA